MLRTVEGGGKLLQVIASPENGLTVSYLHAVVHYAKIYVTVFAKINHLVQKLKIEIITSLYIAKRAEYADIFVFFF